MQASAQEIEGLKKFISSLNLQKNSVVIVEGKRDSLALRKLGFSGKVLEFHKFGGLIRFVDFVAHFETVIVLMDGDRKGRYLTAKINEQLQRRTHVDLLFKKRLISITKGKIRFIEQLVSYESYLY